MISTATALPGTEPGEAKNRVWPACLAPSRLGTVDSHWYVDGRLSTATAQAVCSCVCASCNCLSTVVSYIFQRVDAECGGDAYLRSELCTDPFGLQKAIPPMPADDRLSRGSCRTCRRVRPEHPLSQAPVPIAQMSGARGREPSSLAEPWADHRREGFPSAGGAGVRLT